jgi:serine/threonine-protein kinase
MVGELGRGGMGVVYKARQSHLDRLVAIKLLPAEAGRDSTFSERFTREARALAKLSHPNILTVFDFGQADGQPYFIMEYVDGTNLRQRLRAGRLASEEVLRIIGQVCDALQYAHDEGIVHRDIKPENILLDKKGRVKIADFGIAKLLVRRTAEYTLTGPMQIIGTLNYMAPEQLEDPLNLDHRADIYSLGVMFYEMLTGTLPLGRFLPPSQKAAIDPRLDEIVLKALESDPQRRFQRIEQTKQALQSLRQANRLQSEPPLAALRQPSNPQGTLTTAIEIKESKQPNSDTESPVVRFLGSTIGWAILFCILGVVGGVLPWVSSPFPMSRDSFTAARVFSTTIFAILGFLLTVTTNFKARTSRVKSALLFLAGGLNSMIAGVVYSLINALESIGPGLQATFVSSLGLLFLFTLQMRRRWFS